MRVYLKRNKYVCAYVYDCVSGNVRPWKFNLMSAVK